jgi:hypothetical protein
VNEMLGGRGSSVDDEVAWDIEKRLKIELPFDFNPKELENILGTTLKPKSQWNIPTICFYLDDLLPRVLRLCESGNQNR